jgi:arginase family enzyme
MDVEESDMSILEKIICLQSFERIDPYEAVMNIIRRDIDPVLWKEKKNIPVPTWLRPIPMPDDVWKITLENFINFIDKDGCRYFADEIRDFVGSQILPDVPCMVGVDHCLSGGAIKSCAGLYGREKVSLIVLDSHLDAIPMPVMEGAIKYDLATNPNTVYEQDDPFINNRADSYNTASFLYHLVIREKVLSPENVYIIGINDYPPEEALQLTDPRITNYVRQYTGFREIGANVLTRDEFQRKRASVTEILNTIDTPYIYVSIDLDIGALAALRGVRFINRRGISEEEIYFVSGRIRELVNGGSRRLAGLDIMEFNPRRAILDESVDRTYQIAANLVKIIAFGRDDFN